MSDRTLPELVRELPSDAQEIVRDLVEFLLSRSAAEAEPQSRPLRQDWAGALQAHRDEYTSLDLQHRASEWRISK